MSAELIVLLNGAQVGVVEQLEGGDLHFTYTDEWREAHVSYPLSLSMPLVQTEHGDEVVGPYMEGLLPDNESVLQAWGREFGVSARNPFALLRHVGQDVAGAVQFLLPEQLEASADHEGSVEWLSESQIGKRLAQLAGDRTSWRLAGDAGYFSLAGAQPKTALLWDGDRWGLPSGSIATTHVFKPPAMELEGLAENEHLCLRVAGKLGLPAANSEVRQFDGQVAIVVERYDRYREDDAVIRIHQEDFCQALAVSPRSKYESEGGPGASAIIRSLRDNSSDPEADIGTFVASLGLHWGLGAPDAHGKNYSVLIAPGGQVRLAPLYDVISVLPYPDKYFARKVRLAMQIGGEYRLAYIRGRHWDRFATENDMEPEAVRRRVSGVLEQLPDVISDVCNDAVDEGLSEEFVTVFRDSATRNAIRCVKILDSATVKGS